MTSVRWLPAAALILPTAAVAQQAAPVPTPTPAATPIPIPAAPIGLPTPTPSPLATPSTPPTPAPRAAPAATPSPTAPATRELPRVPAATPTPTPIAAPSPSPSPQAVPPIAALPAPTPQPSPSPSSSSAAADSGGDGLGHWLIVLLVALAAGAGAFVWRRRRLQAEAAPPVLKPAEPVASDMSRATPGVPPPSSPMPAPPPAPSVASQAPPAADTQPPLVIEFRPLRAGVNLLSATVESEVTITNPGKVAAVDLRVEVRMIGAHAGQDADLAVIAREPVSRPAVAPFALQPGEVTRLSVVAALPRTAIVPLDAGGRPIFVPIVTVKLDCAVGAASVRQAVAYAVGVERVDSARLAPFRLDGPPRTFDTVAARVHPIA